MLNYVYMNKLEINFASDNYRFFRDKKDKTIMDHMQEPIIKFFKIIIFSADVSYFTITLLKVYEQIKKNEEIKRYVMNE